MYTQAASKISENVFNACPFCNYLPGMPDESENSLVSSTDTSESAVQRNQMALRKHIINELLGLFIIALPERNDVEEASSMHSNSKLDRSSVQTTYEALPEFDEIPPTFMNTEPTDLSENDEDWSFIPSRLYLDPFFDPKLQSFIEKHMIERTDLGYEQSAWVTSTKESQELIEWLCSLDSEQPDIDSFQNVGSGNWFQLHLEFDRLKCYREFLAWTTGTTKTLYFADDDLSYSSNLAITVYRGLRIVIYAPTVVFLNVGGKSLDTALSSILRQLIDGLGYVPMSTVNLYKRCIDRRTRPSPSEIVIVLTATVAMLKYTFVVIDDLARFGGTNVDNNDLLSAVRNLQLRADLRILVTSQYDTPAIPNFSRRPFRAFRTDILDVKSYLSTQIPLLQESVRNDESLVNYIVDEIAGAADGL